MLNSGMFEVLVVYECRYVPVSGIPPIAIDVEKPEKRSKVNNPEMVTSGWKCDWRDELISLACSGGGFRSFGN